MKTLAYKALVVNPRTGHIELCDVLWKQYEGHEEYEYVFRDGPKKTVVFRNKEAFVYG